MSAPNPATPTKKGLSPIAIVLIVLGCLVMVVGLVVAAAGWFVYNKVTEVAGDSEIWERNPAFAAARLALSVNPEIEVVSSDENSGTMRVRNKQTNEEITISLDDIKNGNFTWSTSGGSSGTMSATAGGITGTTQAGGEAGSFQLGGGEATEPPEGVPACDGCAFKGVMSGTSGSGERTGVLSFTSSKSAPEVAQDYAQRLKDAGYTNINTMSIGGAQMVSGQRDQDTITMNAMAGPRGTDSTGNLTFKLTGQ